MTMALNADNRDLITRTALAELDDPAIQAQIVQGILAAGGDPADYVLSRGQFKSWDNPRYNNPRHPLSIDATSDQYRKVAQLIDSTAASDASAPSAPKSGALLDAFGFNPDGSLKSSTAKTKTPGAAQPGALLEAFGHDVNAPEGRPAAAEPMPPGAVDYITIPGSGTKRYVDARGQLLPVPSYQAPNALARAGEFVSELPGRYGAATSEAFQSANALAASGIEDIRARRYFPTMPSADPSTWTGGGLLKTTTGLIGEPFSLLAGAINPAAEEVDKLTGVPGTGEKAAFLLPGPKVLRTTREMAPSVNALNRVVEENLPTVINRLQSNPTLSLMDVSPGVQTRAIGIAKGEPSAGQTQLFETAEQRVNDRRAQTAHAFESTMGPTPNTVELLAQMKADARKVGTEQINPVLQAASPVDVSPVIAAIDAKLKPGITGVAIPGTTVARGPVQDRLAEIRSSLTDGQSVVTDPMRLHEIQSDLGREANDLMMSATGSDKRLGREIVKVQNGIVDQIDAAAGGQYAPARQAYRDEKDIQRAFDKGQTITSGARTGEAGLENRPEAWQEWMSGATPREQEAARLGARVVIDNHIGTIRQAGRAGADIPDAPFTRAKLDMLFGKDETGRLTQLLADEKAKAETNTLLTRQSVTARAQAAQRETAPRVVEPIAVHAQRLLPAAVLEAVQAPFTGLPGLGTLGLMAYGGVRKGAQAVGRARDIASNNAYARIASTTSPEKRHVILNALAARATRVGYDNKFTNALSRMSTLPLPR